MYRLSTLSMLLLALGFFPAPSPAEEPQLSRRWLYLQQNLQVTENVPKLEAILRRAQKAGYNGVVLADYKLNILDRVPEHYFRNAEQFKKVCGELKLEIIPAVMSFGYSDGILAHDPNLAEGLPCRELPLRIKDGKGVLSGDNPNLVPGDFELRKGDAFTGWSFQDEPGSGTFADGEVKHGGKTALRIENPPGKEGNRRVSKVLKVRPWTQYHASIWVRAKGFESSGETRMFALSSQGRTLSHSHLGVKRDQDWTEHHVIFNSLGDTEVRFYVGVWGCRGGKLWLDDAQVIEEPFVNLVRRPGCPLLVESEDHREIYEEGQDYVALHDSKLGMTPYAGSFEVYHAPPQLAIVKGSRIKEGQKLLVSYYHAVTIYDNQVPCSLSEPKVFEVVEDQVRRVEKLFQPKTYFFSHDEIRVANWSQQDEKAKLTAGQLLAENVKHCVEVVRKVNPQSRLCIWSDMFDPHHNAVDNFYLVNGNLAGAWEGLPSDMTIINWNSGKPKESLSFFASRGHAQVLAGYYDSNPKNIVRWLEAGQGKKVEGAMYTTWQSNFGDLESFAEAAWGKRR